MKQRYSAQEVAAALRQMHGLTHLAAKRLGCSAESIRNYCRRYPSVQQAKEDARGELIDVAEAQLWQALHRGDPWAVQFVLKTLGKDRGYSERTEVTGVNGGPIEHAHIHLWEERLQAVHNAMAAKKAAIMIERSNGHG